jgi:2-keto-4-pentenoate hydratase
MALAQNEIRLAAKRLHLAEKTRQQIRQIAGPSPKGRASALPLPQRHRKISIQVGPISGRAIYAAFHH